MISLNNATLRRGARTLLDSVSFTIYPGWHVGVVGKNGTGKSSLFSLVLGQLTVDSGNVSVARTLAISTVAQETPALPDQAIEFVLDGDVELRELERALLIAEDAHDVARIAKLHDRLNDIGGYAARSRAGTLLHGLGFSAQEQLQAVADFSGGWRMRLNLARALMCRSDLLLLDEPTNHLDLDAAIWLEEFLPTYPGTLLLISHDRDFLDSVCTHTLHLENLKTTLYTGNYSTFERTRAERIALQSASYVKQQRQVVHLQSFINRFKTHASKARQAQSRIKQLEKMQLVAPAHFDSEFSFEFREPERMQSPLLRFDDVKAGYGERAILAGLKLSLQPGDRIGLLGPNGAGKSTFMQTLAGRLEPLAGKAMRDPYLKIGYFAQHQVDQLDLKASPILHLQRLDKGVAEQSLRDFLGTFNFRGDRVYEAVGPFSGGEKARLALALVVYQKPNLLLLDEPTNHLDLDMRHALETALQMFAGAVVLVSHDRHMVSTCCEQLWLVAEGRCQMFDGDLDDYARWLTTRERDAQKSAKPGAAETRRSDAASRAQEKPLKDSIRKLEARMEKLRETLKALEQALTDEDLYTPARKAELHQQMQAQRKARKQLDEVEGEWLAFSEQLETLQQ
ncbi:MAG: ATP-binding cassette domain-containing protein [Stenotrophobium sp.]